MSTKASPQTANILVDGGVYTNVSDDGYVAVVLDLESIKSNDPKGPDGKRTKMRYLLHHAHAVQLGALILQHAGPTPAITEESN